MREVITGDGRSQFTPETGRAENDAVGRGRHSVGERVLTRGHQRVQGSEVHTFLRFISPRRGYPKPPTAVRFLGPWLLLEVAILGIPLTAPRSDSFGGIGIVAAN
ncbi:hypothetical protein KUCAC02_008241 [Chaenocephalus aceratus]|uniref:Uncharacterized protein n=1 Tax=Chaenocephalus aceratus TaxID=36190 RepID=A0ACB9X834_CHAAC|nr:hypothetical protein KUCAC02_008241 [Chaenocephalus aceratus]